MCHDPDTAERFDLALPDRDDMFMSRMLRFKALKSALGCEAEQEEEGGTSNTSTSKEEPTYDDHESSPSEEEMTTSEVQKTSKRRLLFDPESETKRCRVVVKKLGVQIVQYYANKDTASQPLKAAQPLQAPVELARAPAPNKEADPVELAPGPAPNNESMID